MKELPLNAAAEARQLVAESDLASAIGLEPGDQFPAVFATARLVALMEIASARVLRPLLGDGELSVGVGVDIVHTAPTPKGANVTAVARFVGREGKLFVFDVVVSDPGGEIGRGRHRRAIVSAARLEAGAARRRSA